uniref:NADH-ubiquinone oxidoreductase chain 3 n=1 Tax=Eucidaris tribuloides TaxID=7632 RepID=A0A7G3KVC8_EUCTR|nr:NADH dehydrogenase subunit 3 [Eucidaris tribuloides]QEF30097.1 NADH dehydrogenase subunit 3 [Eucidaris tribuloides]QEF30123.1 NADH dehydrogenase subunit 3 [Eucidaris tribuloides]QEF30136.1 NADH dehydrogenase subunit 3 [Eucidaris tribuloides]
MTSLFIILSLIIGISLVLAIAGQILPNRSNDNEKSSPYECGFDPLNSARLPFSFRFFLVAILFLLFDLEIALLFPLPTAQTLASMEPFLLISSVFMIILALGLAFEWINGGLEWAN